MRHFILAIFVLGGGIASAMANFPTTSQITPPELSAPSFQVAGIYWLPDYLKGNAVRAGDSNGGGDVKGECGKYGMMTSCAAPKEPSGAVKPRPDLSCYTKCICPSSYDKTDASCGNGYKAGAAKCDGLANSCVARTCAEGGYYDSSQTGKTCSAVTYGGRTCYACVADPCYNLADRNPCTYGCQTAFSQCTSKCQTCYADNCRNRTAVSTPYGCQSFWGDCPSKCQVAYPDNCRNRTDNKTSYGCDKYWGDCSSKCETGKVCTKTDCSSFTLGSAPANATYTSCTPGCGDTTAKYKLTACHSGFELKNGICVSAKSACELKIEKEAGSVGSYSVDPGEVTGNETVFITKDFNISGRIGGGVSEITIRSFEECKYNGKLPNVSGDTQSYGSEYNLTLDTVRAENIEVNNVNSFTLQGVPSYYGRNAAKSINLYSSCQSGSCSTQLYNSKMLMLNQIDYSITYDFSLLDHLSVENINLSESGKNEITIFSELSSNVMDINSLNLNHTPNATVNLSYGNINISGLNLSTPNKETITMNVSANVTIDTLFTENPSILKFVQNGSGTSVIKNLESYVSTLDFRNKNGGCLKVGYIDSRSGLEMGHLSFNDSKVIASNMSEDICAFPFYNVFISSQSPQYVTNMDGGSDNMGNKLMPDISGSSFSIYDGETCASSYCVPTNFASGEGDEGHNCPDPDSFYNTSCAAEGGENKCTDSNGNQVGLAEQTSPNCWKCHPSLTPNCYLADLNSCSYHEGKGRNVTDSPGYGFSCSGYWYPCQYNYSGQYYACIPGDQPPYGNSCGENGFGDSLDDFWECDPNGNSNIIKDYCTQYGSNVYRCYCPRNWSCSGYGGYNPPF